MSLLLLCILSCLVALISPCTLHISPNVTLHGLSTPTHCAFLGISYASARRFMAPTGPAPLISGNYTAFSPMCPQACILPDGFCHDTVSDECLTLNVYVPYEHQEGLNGRIGAESSLPTLVFLPGGGFEFGAGGCEAFSAQEFASRNSILVTMNYRVGAFGFLVNEELGIKGNMGIRDQYVALQWVQKYIGLFGGDASRVTLAGESAGAQSVAVHMVSPVSSTQGLFSQAVLQSPVFSIWMRTMDSANRLGKLVAKLLKCSTLECMQRAPMDQVIAAQKEAAKKFSLHTLAHISTLFLAYTPVVDNEFLTDQPLRLIQQGKVDKNLPVLIGTNAEEGRMFIHLAFDNPFGSLAYRGVIAALFRSNMFQVLNEYPVSSNPSDDYRELASRVATDYIFSAPTQAAARALAQNGNPVWWYEFDQPLSFGWGPRYAFCDGHACHGAELAFVFAPPLAQKNFTPQERKLSELIATYWTNFVKNSSPIDTSTPNWSALNPTSANCMVLSAESSHMQSNWRTEMRAFWDKIGYDKLYE